jgi:NAD(P)-dependent dehydrogenase (short-subunit alcohol dehydrogenase family)
MSKITRDATAVVTGAGSGIGRALARELARRGSRVVCADIDDERAGETVGLITASGGKGVAVRCDVTNLDDVAALVDAAHEHFASAPTVVANNAGVATGGLPIGELSIEEWRRVVDVNLWGVIHGCHVFTPILRQQGRGGILNVASAASFASAAGMGAYNVSKSGVVSMSETLAAELAGTGIHVTTLCPTFVKTNIVVDGHIEQGSQQLANSLMRLTGRSPDRVARIALDGLDAGRLYVMPQVEAKATWRFKRLAPAAYLAGTRTIGRLGFGIPSRRTDA